MENSVLIGVDTGGTFTDFVYLVKGKIRTFKTLSTPQNPARAVRQGLKELSNDTVKYLVHGSTVATNAVLERKGVKTALITTSGFEDVLEIGRQNRERLYDLTYDKPPPLVPQPLRFGIRERLLYTGEVLEEIKLSAVRNAVAKIIKAGAESVALALVFAYANPHHEKIIEEYCQGRGLFVSASYRILPEFREYERTSTTVLNAYVSPLMKKYISSLASSLSQGDQLRIMQSNGGSISKQTAITESIRTILSGPAGGVVGASEIGRQAGFESLISFDMGGTSTDVSLIHGSVSLTTESKISGWPVKVPMIDIHTVGAGGGSIARFDPGGSLRVGPQSAGADPGPICYGKGKNITVTDANLYLGRLVSDHFLGGKMQLETDGVASAFAGMAATAGIKALDLAEGILEVANATMEKAVRVISIARGFDLREFTLVSFGGAGGLHAVFLAMNLAIPRVLVPQHPGLLSAFGMLLADIVKDYSLTVMLREDASSYKNLLERFSPLLQRGTQEMQQEGLHSAKLILEQYLDMRYQGQSYEIVVPFTKDYLAAFHWQHKRLYGYKNCTRKVEIVNLRVRARGKVVKPARPPEKEAGPRMADEAILDVRDVLFKGKKVKTTIIDRSKLLAGNIFKGPAVIVEYSSTTVVPRAWTARVDKFMNLIIEPGTKR